MSNWINYWRNQTEFSSIIMQKNIDFFWQQMHKHWHVKSDDKILDIGCGYGALAKISQQHKLEYVGADTAKSMVSYCQQIYPQFKFSELDANNYTDLSKVGTGFTKVVVMSVVQYYRNIDDMILLIKSAQKLVTENAEMVIADIPSDHNTIADFGANLQSAWRLGYVKEFVLSMVKILMGNYRFTSKKQPLLVLKSADIEKIRQITDLNIKVLPGNLTNNSRRTNLVITF